MSVELKHLRMLDSIHRHGTISGAARELGCSQPAVSQQVALVERMLGTPVLLRTRSGASLTEAGLLLVRTGRAVLPRVGQALTDIEAIVGLRAGRIRLSCFPSAAAVLLPDAFARLRSQHGGLSFTMFEREPPEALAMLRNGECDVAVVFEYVSDVLPGAQELLPEERAFTIAEENVFVALPESHPLTESKLVALRDLADADWIAGCPNCRQHLLQLCATAGFTPNISFETDDHVAVQGLVAARLGVALLPELMIAAGGASRPVSLRRCAPVSTRVVRIVTTNGLLTVPGVGPTIEALHEAAKAHVTSR
ncbi:MAG: LysR family transcriptional regulator [Microbacterium sp.]